MTYSIQLAERGWLPEWIMRFGMRQLLRDRLQKEYAGGKSAQQQMRASLSTAPVAINTDEANEQHYTIPDAFYRIALGPCLKYSCCYWEDSVRSLEDAEIASLKQVCRRAQIEEGQRILELGCGWGSFSLWAAQNYPKATVTGVSNSPTQRAYIMGQAKKLGLDNLEIITEDINRFEPQGRFDRVVSIEMLEHVRNHARLFERIASWMHKDALFFAHVFSHKELVYTFETDGDNDWMARYFFTGGIMPSRDLFTQYDEHLKVSTLWQLNGCHYSKTLDAWLERIEANQNEVIRVFQECYSQEEALRWYHRWRMFFMACSELFGYDHGEEWGVSHYLMKRKG